MKIAVVGSGGREHALVWKLAQSSLVDKIYALPGNGGMEEVAECVPIPATDIDQIIKFSENVELVIVGPEAPLAEGIVNKLPENKAFGPIAQAAAIESDKSFSKELMRRAGILTAEFEIFTAFDAAKSFVETVRYPLVIKASGLAAGKGVIIAQSEKDALDALNRIMVEQAFGESGDKVVIEEFLEGEEVSVIAFTDGKDFLPLLPCQDNKKLLDGDGGPNTGGMGAYGPAVLTRAEVDGVIEKVFEPCVWEMRKQGIVYKGALYAGLIMTSGGPKVLEFNCRCGDPETQPVMKLLKTDLMEPILATIEENLKSISLEWHDGCATCVVLASGGYPGQYEKGKEITGLEQVKETTVFHAGTKREGNKVLTSGGRVLGVTGIGKDLRTSADQVYEEISRIHFDGMYYRKDIGRNDSTTCNV
jgi:phosphoribosylamine--glycine ligase